MKRVIADVKSFFESYEVANILMDQKGILISIFEASSKNILQVKVIEVPLFGTAKFRTQRNMFCDVRVESNMLKMTFKLNDKNNAFKDALKSVIKNDYVVKKIGNQLTIVIIEPTISEIGTVFNVIEPFCKKFKK